MPELTLRGVCLRTGGSTLEADLESEGVVEDRLRRRIEARVRVCRTLVVLRWGE